MAQRSPEPVERTGKTVDEAVQRALRDLGLDRAEVEVRVMSEGRPGVLGIGAASARVRVAPLAPGAPVEATPAPSEQALPRIDDYALDTREEVGPRERPPRGGPGRGGPGRGGEGPNAGREGPSRGGDGPGRSSSSDRGDRGGRPDRGERPPDRGRRGPGRERERPEPHVPLEERIPFELLASPMEEPVDDPIEHAENILRDMMRIMGVDAAITSRPPETPMDSLDHAAAVLEVNPTHAEDDLGFLIGERGQYLAALQYIVNLILSQTFSGGKPITVDVHQYKRRREESLNALARQMADEARRTREAVDLEPMPPAERRIIHIALADEADVVTESAGQGDARRVTVVYRTESQD